MDLYTKTIQWLKKKDTEKFLADIPDHTITSWLLQKILNQRYGENGVLIDPEHQVIVNMTYENISKDLHLQDSTMSDHDIEEVYRGIADGLNLHMQKAYQLRGLL